MCHLVVVNPSKSYLRAYGIMVKHLTPDQRIRVRFLMRLFRGSNPVARVAVCKTVTKKHRRFESYLPHFGKLAQLVEH